MKEEKINRKKVKISLRQYYYFALWLPVIFPSFSFLLIYHIPDIQTVDFLFYGVLFGIVQYVVFALWTVFKYRGAVIRELKQFSYTAPFSFIPFYAAGFLLVSVFTHGGIPSIDSIFITLVFSLICIPVGYFYIVLAYIIELIMEKIGFIEEEFI